MAKSAILTLGYQNTSFSRILTIEGVADSISADDVKAAVNDINASLSAGTSGGLDTFFVADNFDASDSNNIIGAFNAITDLVIHSREETIII